MTLLNQGFGPIGFISVRQLDDEDNPQPESNNGKKRQLEAITRTGILGRLTEAVRRKVFEITCQKGGATVGGEVDDAPFALMMIIVGLLHSYSKVLVYFHTSFLFCLIPNTVYLLRIVLIQ